VMQAEVVCQVEGLGRGQAGAATDPVPPPQGGWPGGDRQVLHLFQHQDEVRGEPGWQGGLSDMQQDPHEWRCLGPPGPEKLAFPLGPRPQPRALRRWGVRLSRACWSQVPSAQPPQVTLSLSWVEGALTRMGTLIPAGAPWDLLDNPELVWPPWGLGKGPAVPGWKKQMLRLAKNSRPCSQADAMKPRIISKINRQVVPPVRAILALGGCEGHPVGGRGMSRLLRVPRIQLRTDPRSRDTHPTLIPLLLGREPADLALISRSISFTLCVLGRDTHLSGPPRPCQDCHVGAECLRATGPYWRSRHLGGEGWACPPHRPSWLQVWELQKGQGILGHMPRQLPVARGRGQGPWLPWPHMWQGGRQPGCGLGICQAAGRLEDTQG